HDGEERRAVAVEAREVEVARGLMDLRLAAERGLDGQHRQAAGDLAAVAAALAHALVDHDALRRGRERAATASAPLLDRALLVVDQDRHARHGSQLLLRAPQLLARTQVGVPGESRAGPAARVLARDD